MFRNPNLAQLNQDNRTWPQKANEAWFNDSHGPWSMAWKHARSYMVTNEFEKVSDNRYDYILKLCHILFKLTNDDIN